MAGAEQSPRFLLPARGWGIVLIASLCLNLLIIGTAATLWWRWSTGHDDIIFAPRGDRAGPGRHGGHGFGLGRGPLNPHVMASLAPEKREMIRGVLQAHRDKVQTLRRASFEARRKATDTLAAPGYTPQKFAEALEQVRLADTALEAEVLETMKECAALLSPQERLVIARARREGGIGGPGPEPKDGHGPGRPPDSVFGPGGPEPGPMHGP